MPLRSRASFSLTSMAAAGARSLLQGAENIPRASVICDTDSIFAPRRAILPRRVQRIVRHAQRNRLPDLLAFAQPQRSARARIAQKEFPFLAISFPRFHPLADALQLSSDNHAHFCRKAFRVRQDVCRENRFFLRVSIQNNVAHFAPPDRVEPGLGSPESRLSDRAESLAPRPTRCNIPFEYFLS